MNVYYILAIVWIILCVAIGLYIVGAGVKEKNHYKIGFITLAVSYIIGVSLLISIIAFY